MNKSLLLIILFTISILSKAQVNTNSQWTWVKGDNTANSTGIYGTIETASGANKPGAREGSVSWKDASGNLWLFGGSGYTESSAGLLNDLWKYTPSTNQWTWMKGASTINNTGVYGTKGTEAFSNVPGARFLAVSWTDLAGNLWLFGGSGYATATSGQLNDLWKYNPVTNAWTWVNGDSTLNVPSIYGMQGISSAANKPGGRFNSTTWVDASGNFWLFGGRGNDNASPFTLGNFNDLWKYDVTANQWTWVKGDNTRNSFGVYGTQGVASPANKPGGRHGSIGWKDAVGNLWLLGGEKYLPISGIFSSYNDLWKYDPLSNQWTWMKGDDTENNAGVYGVQGTANPANKPGARHSGVSWTDMYGSLWLFGGQVYYSGGGGSVVEAKYNDLWKYTPSTNQWTWIKGDNTANNYGIYGSQNIPASTNKPGARYRSLSWMDNTGNLWLFGGSGFAASSVGSLNDLWKLNTNNPLPVFLLSISASVRQNDVLVNWKTSQEINTSHFLVEGSADGRNFLPIGSITAAGNSHSLRNYLFVDQQPLEGNNYYRVKMYDIDSSFTYSPVVKVSLQSIKNNITVYPNPVITTASIHVISGVNASLTLRLHDSKGQLVRTQQASVTAGNNLITLDMSSLAQGIYIASITWGQEFKNVKIIKE